MSERESQTGAEARAKKIQGMFSDIAPTYDLLNRILSLGVDTSWREALVARLPKGRTRVLDLACGTGDVSIAAAERRERARVYGADFSLPMLRGAQPKIERRHLHGRIRLQNASAEDLPYRDGVFHAVTIAFGIRNVVRRERALGEMFRVLRPGGRVLILDFSMPPNPLARRLYGLYFHRVLPFFGGLVSGNRSAYRYLPESVAGFPAREAFVASLQEAGFTAVGYDDFTLGVATLYRGVRPGYPKS